MRAPLLVAALASLACLPGVGAAEPLPPGSIGITSALASGTFADATRLGYGWQYGAQAAWQPMRTENRLGFAVKWSFAFGTMYNATAARVGDTLLTFQMDVTAGLRIRPGTNATRYITVRVGPQLMRTDQVIPSMTSETQRAFAGFVASVGVDQYAGLPFLGGRFLYNLDVRVNQIGTGPSIIALMLGIGKTGP